MPWTLPLGKKPVEKNLDKRIVPCKVNNIANKIVNNPDTGKVQTATEIYQILRDEIVQGKINPGERLIEKDLCERLETTRGYVREALKILSADGFVSIIHGKGATVSKISYQEIKDLYELLAVLEAKSVALAVPNLSLEDIEELHTANEKMRSCIGEPDRAMARRQWQKANLQFHKIIAEKSGNRELRDLLSSIRWRTFDFRYVYFFEREYPFFVKQHDSMIQAIEKKNGKRAKNIMENHVIDASRVVLRNLEKIPDL